MGAFGAGAFAAGFAKRTTEKIDESRKERLVFLQENKETWDDQMKDWKTVEKARRGKVSIARSMASNSGFASADILRAVNATGGEDEATVLKFLQDDMGLTPSETAVDRGAFTDETQRLFGGPAELPSTSFPTQESRGPILDIFAPRSLPSRAELNATLGIPVSQMGAPQAAAPQAPQGPRAPTPVTSAISLGEKKFAVSEGKMNQVRAIVNGDGAFAQIRTEGLAPSITEAVFDLNRTRASLSTLVQSMAVAQMERNQGVTATEATQRARAQVDSIVRSLPNGIEDLDKGTIITPDDTKAISSMTDILVKSYSDNDAYIAALNTFQPLLDEGTATQVNSEVEDLIVTMIQNGRGQGILQAVAAQDEIRASSLEDRINERITIMQSTQDKKGEVVERTTVVEEEVVVPAPEKIEDVIVSQVEDLPDPIEEAKKTLPEDPTAGEVLASLVSPITNFIRKRNDELLKRGEFAVKDKTPKEKELAIPSMLSELDRIPKDELPKLVRIALGIPFEQFVEIVDDGLLNSTEQADWIEAILEEHNR